MTEKKLRALVVGTGGLGRTWVTTIGAYEETEVAGMVDIRPDVAAAAARDLGLPDIYTGTELDEALEAVKPDFVVDVTTPSAHRDVVICALGYGVPVLGEKPMADSLESAREMIAASERSGKLYMVSQSRRYDPNLVALRQLIRDDLGAPGILNCDFYIGWHIGEFRHGLVHILLLDMGVHLMDMARYLSGEEPVAVYCEEFNPPWSWYHGLSSAIAIFEMTNGLRFTFRGSWSSEGRHTAWQGEWRVAGPHGSATWDGHGVPVAEIVTGPGGLTSQFETRIGTPPAGMPGYFAGSLRDFVRALKTGATPMGECHDNIKSLEMVFAAIESATKRERLFIGL
jgi:predicted dehydrogenase